MLIRIIRTPRLRKASKVLYVNVHARVCVCVYVDKFVLKDIDIENGEIGYR